MDRFRLSHILLCGLISPILVTSFAATQNRDAAAPVLSAPYQKWLDEDVRYLISDEERAEFNGLKTDQQRDQFVEDFWERRNPNPGSTENTFKEEHYRRLAYVNQHFAAGVLGFKTDRGRIYILYGPPDEREQHPGRRDESIPADAPLRVRYPSDVWRYHVLKGVGRDVYFEFIDDCRCGEYQLREDPTKKGPPSTRSKETLSPVKTFLLQRYQNWMTDEVFVAITDQERAELEEYSEPSNSNPGSSESTGKIETCLRTIYANEHFAANVPGWKTDRGRIYIRYGPPDRIDQHFSAAGSEKASDLIGVGAIPFDWELWHYRFIEGIGKDVAFTFVDTCGCGRYQIPVTKEALERYKPHSLAPSAYLRSLVDHLQLVILRPPALAGRRTYATCMERKCCRKMQKSPAQRTRAVG